MSVYEGQDRRSRLWAASRATLGVFVVALVAYLLIAHWGAVLGAVRDMLATPTCCLSSMTDTDGYRSTGGGWS